MYPQIAKIAADFGRSQTAATAEDEGWLNN